MKRIPFILLMILYSFSSTIAQEPFGVNLAGAEFGENFPGVFGTDYPYPTAEELDYYNSKGLKLIRLPFAWERIQHGLNANLDTDELNRLKDFVQLVTDRNMQVILDLHNYGRRFNADGVDEIIGSANLQIAHVKDVWTKLATEFKDETNIWGYGIMNEPHDMLASTPWFDIAQAIINGIRTVDMSTKIIVGGDSWSSAERWPEESDNLKNLVDPSDNMIFEAHVYFDNDASGTYRMNYDDEGAYPNLGIDRVKPFVDWLAENNFKGYIGEYGIPDNDARWLVVLDNFLAHLQSKGINGTYWAGGPWWGTDFMAIDPVDADGESDPVNGTERPQMGIVEKYLETNEDALPVSYLSPLTTRLQNEVVLLSWQTSEEYNADYYLIERSTNGKDWDSITKVKAFNQSHSYSLIDKNPLSPISYYRLKQVDYDASFSISKIVSIRISDSLGTTKIFPNPTKGKLSIETNRKIESIEVFNYLGEKITILLQANTNTLNLDGLVDGVYFIKINSSFHSTVHKFVIRH